MVDPVLCHVLHAPPRRHSELNLRDSCLLPSRVETLLRAAPELSHKKTNPQPVLSLPFWYCGIRCAEFYFQPIWSGSDFTVSRDTPARVCERSRPPRGCGKGRGPLDNLAFRAVRFVAFSARSWRVVGMAPKQATLGYVRPSQTTIGWVDEGREGLVFTIYKDGGGIMPRRVEGCAADGIIGGSLASLTGQGRRLRRGRVRWPSRRKRGTRRRRM